MNADTRRIQVVKCNQKVLVNAGKMQAVELRVTFARQLPIFLEAHESSRKVCARYSMSPLEYVDWPGLLRGYIAQGLCNYFFV